MFLWCLVGEDYGIAGAGMQYANLFFPMEKRRPWGRRVIYCRFLLTGY